MENHESELIEGFGEDWTNAKVAEDEELEESEASIDFEKFKEEFETMLLEYFAKHYQNDLNKVKEDIHSIINNPDMDKFQEQCEAYKKKWEQQTAEYKHIDLTTPENAGTRIYLQSLEVHSTQNYSSFIHYLHDSISIQKNILAHFQQDLTEIYQTIEKKANELYPPHPEQKNQLPTLKSVSPCKYIVSNNRLSNELQKNRLFNIGDTNLVVANRDKSNEITSVVCVTYDKPPEITGKPYTEYDRAIHDTVCSLCLYGHPDKIFTPEMVYRVMTGNKNVKPKPQTIEEIAISLDKMAFSIHVKVDATAELQFRNATLNNNPVTDYRLEGQLLPLKKVEIIAGGKKITAYKLLDEPILLTYSKAVMQLLTEDAEMFDIKEVTTKGKVTNASITSSSNRIAVKMYLFRRIAVMKHDKQNRKNSKQSNIILFDTLFEETGIPNDGNAKRIKEYCFQVLDYWKAIGYIKGYTKREKTGKGRRSIDAIIIKI